MALIAHAVPWSRKEFDGWSIVGMNHYNIDGQRRLFVSMAKSGRCIKAEGPDDPALWRELAEQAQDANPKRVCHYNDPNWEML